MGGVAFCHNKKVDDLGQLKLTWGSPLHCAEVVYCISYVHGIKFHNCWSLCTLIHFHMLKRFSERGYLYWKSPAAFNSVRCLNVSQYAFTSDPRTVFFFCTDLWEHAGDLNCFLSEQRASNKELAGQYHSVKLGKTIDFSCVNLEYLPCRSPIPKVISVTRNLVCSYWFSALISQSIQCLYAFIM